MGIKPLTSCFRDACDNHSRLLRLDRHVVASISENYTTRNRIVRRDFVAIRAFNYDPDSKPTTETLIQEKATTARSYLQTDSRENINGKWVYFVY